MGGGVGLQERGGGLPLQQDKELVLVKCSCRCLVSDHFLLDSTFFLTKRENVYGGGRAVGQWGWKGPGNKLRVPR